MSFSREKAQQIAAQLNCEAAVVLAVAEVESGGRHDLPDGRPQILFEAQWFSKLTSHRYDANYPNISSPTWNRSLYRGGAAEYGRLEAAMALDRNAALQSASWGLFQIMGFNYRAAGFPTVEAYVEFIKGPDDADMEAFINFVKANPAILAAMRNKDWEQFALHYNGPGDVPSYSAKMADDYAKYAGQPDRQAEGPPLPVVDPTIMPQSPASSKTVIAGGVGGVATLASLADQVNTVSYTAATAGNSLGSLVRTFGPIVLGVLALGAIAYFTWRYIQKLKTGEVTPK